MIVHIFYFLLALIGLGFLIFIHELGHYFMARRVGMTIEVFSIGLGKPIYFWTFQGVKWQLCVLPFGGYVKIAGEKEESTKEAVEPRSDTFFGKKPWERIQVALMGPVVNMFFALAIFTLIWACGGKSEAFSRHTRMIGYVDPDSALYLNGVRPGDEIVRYNHKAFTGFKDLLYTSVLKQKSVEIEGETINYYEGNKKPFHYILTPYRDPRTQGEDFRTIGVLTPASILMFTTLAEGSDFPLTESPMYESGIQPGDRLVWAQGELLFSMPQLAVLVNEPKTLLSVKRGETIVAVKVPRLKVGDLRLSEAQKLEFEDWQHQIHKKGAVKDLFFIPYLVSAQGIVRSTLSYIGENSEEHPLYESGEGMLFSGDQIISVDGRSVQSGYALLEALQTKHVQLIVERGFPQKGLTWKNENEVLLKSLNPQDLTTVVQGVLHGKENISSGNLYALKPVEPILLSDLPLSSAKKNWLVEELVAQKERIEKISNPQMRAQALKALEKQRQKLVLGIPLNDVAVQYNPNPFTLFAQVMAETGKTLSSLFTGKLNPKWISGPIGMVQILHHGWAIGIKEALFWMAVVSLNLGVFNLLPLPVLDGGHICFSLYEWICKRRVHPKTMEKLIVPFIALLIGLFVYVTYQDIVRLFSRFF